MKNFFIFLLFAITGIAAALFVISCSKTPTGANFQTPVQTLVAINPTWSPTFTYTFTSTSTITNTPTVTATPTPYATNAPWTGFSGPLAVAVDKNSNVYVADTGNNLIKQYTNGVLNTSWGAAGKHKGSIPFNSPCALAVDSSGYLYVTGYGSNLVTKYYPNGNLKAQYTVTGAGVSLLGLAVSGSTLYVSDSVNKQIVSLSLPGGGLNTSFNGTGMVSLSSPSTIAFAGTPYGLAVDLNGNVYVAVSNGTTTAAGNNIQEFGSNGSAIITIQGFNAPYGIAVDNNYSLYVADTNNHQVEEFLVNSYVVPTNIFGIGALSSPRGIAIDPNPINNNNLYVTDSANNEVFEYVQ